MLARGLSFIAVAALALATFLPAARARETVKVGLCVSWPGYAMLEVARQKDLLAGYDIALTIFEDPSGGHAALAAGKIDVYACTADAIPLTVERDDPVVNVAFTNPSYGVDHILLAPSVKPGDLVGGKVAAPRAYIGQLLMGLWLDSVGIAPDQVRWINLNADEAVGPMVSGDIAATYSYEPWVSRVLETLRDARSVIDTADPMILKTGIFMDALYMNTSFIEKHRKAALAILKARWDGLGYWHAHTNETNALIATFLRWPLADVVNVIGTDGKSKRDGIYMFDFDEAARMCGVLAGDPPFGLANGGMPGAVAQTNAWWIKLGLMTNSVAPSKGIDCSLMGDLAAAGYRQSFGERD